MKRALTIIEELTTILLAGETEIGTAQRCNPFGCASGQALPGIANWDEMSVAAVGSRY